MTLTISQVTFLVHWYMPPEGCCRLKEEGHAQEAIDVTRGSRQSRSVEVPWPECTKR